MALTHPAGHPAFPEAAEAPDQELHPATEPEQPDDAPFELADDFGPGPIVVELRFATDPTKVSDQAAAWKCAQQLIESAKAKGLELEAGGVRPDDTPTTHDEVLHALAEIQAEQHQ